MMNEPLSMSGKINAVLTNEHGDVIAEHDVSNLIMTVGKTWAASRLAGTASAVISHMAIGSGNTAPAVGQTTLVTETARVAITSGTASGNVLTIVATFGPGVGTGSINECGLFNAASAGTMVARSTNVVLTKGATDTLALTWTITLN